MYVNVARLVMCCYLSCFAAPSPRASYSHISWPLATNLMVLYVFLAIHYIPIVSLSFSSFLHGFTPQLWLPLAAAFFFFVNSILFTSTTLLNIPSLFSFLFFSFEEKTVFCFWGHGLFHVLSGPSPPLQDAKVFSFLLSSSHPKN